MTYKVLITQEVLDAIDAQLAYLRHESAPSDRVDRWLTTLIDLADSLDHLPRRFPIAEAVSAAKGYEVRRANHGEYAMFFRIDEKRNVVEIIAFRHGRRQPWLQEE